MSLLSCLFGEIWLRGFYIALFPESNILTMLFLLYIYNCWLFIIHLLKAFFTLKAFSHYMPLHGYVHCPIINSISYIANSSNRHLLVQSYNKNTRTMCETCSNIIKTRRWRRSGVFIVNSEQISHIFLVLLLLTLN